jgi:3-isopropylmalate dehydrogenase
MLLRHSLGLDTEAATVESAVTSAINGGARTADFAEKGQIPLRTAQMGEAAVPTLTLVHRNRGVEFLFPRSTSKERPV